MKGCIGVLMKEKIYIESPIGMLAVCCEEGYVTAISIVVGEKCGDSVVTPFTASVKSSLNAYFNSEIKEFDFPLLLKGTAFQVMVWKELLRIPYGETVTYGEIAARMGRPHASRAVGNACNRNPLLVVVPCHRAVGSGGKITGYVAGVEKKKFLLELERGNSFSSVHVSGKIFDSV